MLYRIAFDGTVPGSQIIDVRQDDTIEVVSVAARLAAEPNVSTSAQIELSFLSASQFDVNDTTGVVWSALLTSDALGAGLVSAKDMQVIIPMPSLPISSGERIYLHWDVTSGSVSGYVHIYTAKTDLRPATRRR
jgi:hypothetical protein